MIAYVVGFAFDAENVALIRKLRPDWQKGHLNGIGGHIEKGEPSHTAMVREFEEEAGLEVPAWETYIRLQGGGWSCDFFRAFDVDLTRVKTMTDEEVIVVPARSLPSDVLVDLNWLIPLALDPQPRIPIFVLYD